MGEIDAAALEKRAFLDHPGYSAAAPGALPLVADEVVAIELRQSGDNARLQSGEIFFDARRIQVLLRPMAR